MIRTCISCGKPTILAREIDGNLRVIDEQPVDGGPLVAWGDMLDQPTIFWGVDPAGETALEGGAVGQPLTAGQTVWCRTADGDWWKTTAAGPLGRSIGRPSWPAVPVLGWDRDDPEHPVNWPAEDVRTTDPRGTG